MDLQFLIIHELIHFTVGLPAAAFLYWRYKKWSFVFVLYLVIHFVDVDHMADYFLWAGFSLQNPLVMTFFDNSQKIYIPFHAWEYVVVLFFLAWKFKKVIFLVVALGLTSHFLIDQFVYTTNVFSYSIIYRIIHNFSQASFNYLSL